MEIFALTSFTPKKPVTWLRWRHNDITSQKTMVTLVEVNFEIIILQRAVSEIFVLTSARFEKAGTLPGWCHRYVFRVGNAGRITTIASSRCQHLKTDGQFWGCGFWMIIWTHAVSEILSVIPESDCWSICDGYIHPWWRHKCKVKATSMKWEWRSDIVLQEHWSY